MLHHQLEALLRDGRHEEVLAEAGRFFARPDTTMADPVWVAVWACRAAGGRRKWAQAVTWADRGLGLGGHDPEAEGILRFTAARALMYIGDLLRAQRELQRFLTLADTTEPLRKGLPDALYNLAHLHRWLRRGEEALRLYDRAAAAYRDMGRVLQVAQCRIEVAWSHLLAGSLGGAETALNEAQSLLDGSADAELKLDLSIATAFYYHLTGDVQESDRICLSASHLLHPRQAGEIAWIMGRNALGRGELERAAEFLAAAHEAAVEIWWPPLLERVDELRDQLTARGVPAS